MLKKIQAQDLLFTNEIEDDRTNTYLTLNDYDWMQYILKTKFKTIELGILKVEFEYFGHTKSTMKVIQCHNKDVQEFIYSYDSNIFKKYIKKYLQKHIDMWESKYAFNGEEFVIDFYNEVLDVGKLTDGVHLND